MLVALPAAEPATVVDESAALVDRPAGCGAPRPPHVQVEEDSAELEELAALSLVAAELDDALAALFAAVALASALAAGAALTAAVDEVEAALADDDATPLVL